MPGQERFLNLNLRARKRLREAGLEEGLRRRVAAGLLAAVNSAMGSASRMAVPVGDGMPEAPVFIIGHWRSGTTLLHEMLSQDAQFTFPNTYECLYPSHFLLTEQQYFKTHQGNENQVARPMDSMLVSMESPQEDEFALLCLGAVSPYLWMIMPGRFDHVMRKLDPASWSQDERDAWQDVFLHFLRSVMTLRPGRLLLKSPTHAFRVGLLSRMFPDARFVHIVRNPDHVFPSTLRMWRSMFDLYAVHGADADALPGQVLQMGQAMEAMLEKDIPTLDQGRYLRLRYEDLVASPAHCMDTLYEHFGLEGKALFLAKLEAFLDGRRSYTARSEMPEADHLQLVRREWSAMYENYGYPVG